MTENFVEKLSVKRDELKAKERILENKARAILNNRLYPEYERMLRANTNQTSFVIRIQRLDDASGTIFGDEHIDEDIEDDVLKILLKLASEYGIEVKKQFQYGPLGKYLYAYDLVVELPQYIST